MIEFAVQARNSAGDETEVSESVVATKPDLLSNEDSDSNIDIAVPTNAPIPLQNKIATLKNEIKELRTKVSKIRSEVKELTLEHKSLNQNRIKLTKILKNLEKDKKSGQDEIEKTSRELAGIQDRLKDSKTKRDVLKSEQKPLKKLLSEKTSELKKLKKQRKMEKQNKKS